MSYTIDSDFRANGNSNGWTNPRSGYCIHHSAGTSIDMAGTFLANSTSAHYGVEPGHVRQFVEDGKGAWAAGNNWANNNLIHIECVNSSTGGDWPVAEGTVDTLVEFLADKMRERGETKLVVGSNLYGHRDFYATYCPGVLYARLGEIADRVNALLEGSDDEVTNDDIEKIADRVIEKLMGHRIEIRGDASAKYGPTADGYPSVSNILAWMMMGYVWDWDKDAEAYGPTKDGIRTPRNLLCWSAPNALDK